jgi:hypothetical protein
MGFLDKLFGREKKTKPPAAPQRPQVKPDFPLGANIISDADIKTFADLTHHYPLPAGFEYQQTDEGVPVIVRRSDAARFDFLIEAEMLTFNEPYTKPDGKTAYKTTEVFKRA